MTPQEFKKRMQTLQEVILRALTNYEVMKKLRYNDENDEDWTLDQQNNLLGRFKGFFSPVSLALTDMTFIQFAKIFDPNKRTASFRILLDAALEDASLLSHISADEFAEVRQDVEDSKALVAKLKRLRDQQLAHADANPLPVEPITLGDLDKLAESIKTNFNRLSSGHDKSIIGWDFALRTSEQDTTAVLRALMESEERRTLGHEETMVRIGLDHLRRTEVTFGHTLGKETVREAIGTLGLTKEQMQRVEKEYQSRNQGAQT